MKSKRVLLGLSQAELAKKVGIARQTIVLIEQEKYNPSIKLCIGICTVLGTTLDELFWKGEKNER